MSCGDGENAHEAFRRSRHVIAQAPARRAVNAAAGALFTFFACLAGFLPPLVQHTTDSVALAVLLGMAMGVSFVLHLVFVGVAARRFGRRPVGWVLLALVLFPIASIVGLVLMEWFGDEKKAEAEAAAAE